MSDVWIDKVSSEAEKIPEEIRDKYVQRILKGESALAVENSLGLTNDQACGIIYLFSRGSNESAGDKG